VFPPKYRDGWCSELIIGGVQIKKDRSTDEVERFLSMLRFDSRGKMEELLTKADPSQTN
jgi:hypothetical protein